jgi:hypothetical protein
MDFVEVETDYCSETFVKCDVDGIEEINIKEDVTDMKDEITDISVGIFKLSLPFLVVSHDKAQFNWCFYPCLQDVSKIALLTKDCDISVFLYR